MKSWFGSLLSSPHADPMEVTVLATAKDITIGYRRDDGTVQTQKWDTAGLEVSFDSSLQSTRITSAKAPGSKLLIEGKDAMNFLQQAQAEQHKPWHKKQGTKNWVRSLLILTGFLSLLVLAYFLAVPWLSEKLAGAVPAETEAQFGNAVYDALVLANEENKESSAALNEFFSEMKIKSDYNIRITVVNAEIVNAFALPGGNIVVYTGLLRQLQTYPELAALLSHEFTHVNNRHSTKSVFRQLGSRVFQAWLLGNFGSVSSVLIDQADRFKSLKYSRALEKEADMDGLEILKARKIDPEGFARLFDRLKDSAGSSAALPEFLASHPDIDKRINYIREASANIPVEEHTPLRNIFQKIKRLK